MPTTPKHFPKSIFVVRNEPENDDPFLMVIDDLNELDRNGELVATYELKSVRKLSINKELMKPDLLLEKH